MRKLAIGLLIIGVIVGAGAYTLLNTAGGQDALLGRVIERAMSRTPASFDGLRVVVCGSASPLGNDPNRAQACIAVVTPEHFFLFDVGGRSPVRIAQAQLPVRRLDGVFLTHFHSDHISDLADVNLTSWVQGRTSNLKVYGPKGVTQVVDGFNMAYVLDRKYRNAHHGEALLPAKVGAMTAHPFTDDGIVWQDDTLSVTAFTVEHPPIEPAVGYRVDYKGRSVVISGDTNASDNLFTYAKGADLLLHDALSRTLLDPMIETATALNVPVMPTIMTDVIDYHADSTTLAARAKEAGIRQLAFYHMVPVPANGIAEDIFMRGLPDDIILASDLQTFDMAPNSDTLEITTP